MQKIRNPRNYPPRTAEPPMRQSLPENKPRSAAPQKRKKTYLIALVVMALVATSGYYFYQYRKLAQNPQAVAESEIKKITGKIGKFMDLPEGEQPTLATVADKEKLKEQIFFEKAENGDKALIYQNAKKAILYRPSTGRVVEVMSLIPGQ